MRCGTITTGAGAGGGRGAGGGATGYVVMVPATGPGAARPVATRLAAACADIVDTTGAARYGRTVVTSSGRSIVGSAGRLCVSTPTTELGFAAAIAAIARGFTNGITFGGGVV